MRKSWQRMHPDRQKLINRHLISLIFDGDHAIQNRFVVRGRYSLEDMICEYLKWVDHQEKQKLYREQLKSFQEQAANGQVLIQLESVSSFLFYSSEEEESFWRIAFELYKTQEKSDPDDNDGCN